jgi:hypothetical protein
MKIYTENAHSSARKGIVLLITLVILVVLSMIGYTLSSRVLTQRLRNQYLIDYGQARYGCDSAMKYALAAMESIEPELVSRPNEPDFSDLFALGPEQYKAFIAQWIKESQASDTEKSGGSDTGYANDTETNEISSVSIKGPYGAPWPLITEPAVFQIGAANVQIEIEDEEAKYPLGWAMVEDDKIQRELDAGFETFCEMSGLEPEQIDSLKSNLKAIRKIRPFKINFEPVVTTTRQTVKTPTSSTRGSTSTTTQVLRTVLTTVTQSTNQATSFAKFFNSNLLDREMLAKPTIIDGERKESPLKYISTWGTTTINVNTAPRHVLEAAFIFGGDQVDIADQIIELRKVAPFENFDDLQKRIYGFSDSIEKCKTYITTQSNLFTIRVTSVCGMAKASAVIAVTKNGNSVKKIAAVSG